MDATLEDGVCFEYAQFIFRTSFDVIVLILGHYVASARSSNKVLHLYTIFVLLQASLSVKYGCSSVHLSRSLRWMVSLLTVEDMN